MREEKIEYIRNWIFRANEDYAVIKSLEKSGIESYTSTICFHAQQAVEKYFKAFLIYNDIDFPRTHDVDYLVLECKKIDDENFDFDLKSLTEFGVSVRYPDDLYIPILRSCLRAFYPLLSILAPILLSLSSMNW